MGGRGIYPRVTLAQTLAIVEDYDHNHDHYQPEVLASRLVSRDGNGFKVYMRLMKKKVITVILDTDYDVRYFPLDSTRCHSRAYSTRIAEVQNAGKPDEIFPEIAADLERGSARRLYSITEKPDVSRTPVPRFDLLALNKYTFMSVQFSRGCPFTCEFCDIITIYGRRPRTKSPAQLIGELDALLQLGWRKEVFVVDDNFIGNHKAALELAQELERWQRRNRYPFGFFTEASIDLASRPALLDAMVKANFCRVFIGIESPSAESLKEAKKFQNLRRDPLDNIRLIQQHGLWVMGGFIVGFDSDPPDIFDRQIEFVERAAIPWAMAGVLQAPPTTPLYERIEKGGPPPSKQPRTE